MIKMFVKIPFESDLEFKTNISEITKMSLEHDFNINDGVALGNFYISGEYKTHELSLNKEEFNFTLPFTVDIRSDLDRDTIEFNIEDFTYDIKDNTNLHIFIEYSLKGEIEEKRMEDNKDIINDTFKSFDESSLESELEYIDNFLDNKEESKDTLDAKEEKEELNEDRELSKENEKTVMDTIKDSDDIFVTYHIHIIKESETIESISALYKMPTSLIGEYNNIDNIVAGDKLIIPVLDE